MTLRLNGDSSGFTEIKAPNAAGDNSITLPTSNGGANQLLQNGGTAGALQYTSAGGGLRYDSSGRLLVNSSTARSGYFNTTAYGPLVNFEGTSNSNRIVSFIHNDSSGGPMLVLGATGGSAAGNTSLVNDGTTFGFFSFQGSDGNELVEAARISAEGDGTAASNAMPGKLLFYTTGSGNDSPTARLELGSNGALKLLAGCPGIDFSAIQSNNAGMTSETLDSYEEGVWSLTPTGGTWSVNRAGYIKVGRKVTIFFSGSVSSPTSADVSFPLPFASDTSLGTASSGIEGHGAVMFHTANPPSNTFTANVYCWDTTANIYFSVVNSSWQQAVGTQVGGVVQFTATYFAAA